MVMTFLILAPSVAAQQQTLTFQVNNGNQPAGGVPLYMLAGGRKFSPSTPATGTTDNTGRFVFPPGLLSSNKPRTQMEVWEVCVNGQKVIFVIPKGSEALLPEDTQDCKKRRIGGFYWDGGSTVTVDLALGGGVTQTGGGPAPRIGGGQPLVGGQVSFGLGFENFPGASEQCRAFRQVFPSGNCSINSNAFALRGDGSLNVWYLRLTVGGWHDNDINLKASATEGAVTFKTDSTLQFNSFYAIGGVKLPLPGGFLLIPEGGLAHWSADSTFTQAMTIGATTTSVTDSTNFSGNTPVYGVAVEKTFAKYWGAGAHYLHLNYHDKPQLSENSHRLFFHVFFTFGRR
jgi:hypothetical protein